jgi:hypothetical protein
MGHLRCLVRTCSSRNPNPNADTIGEYTTSGATVNASLISGLSGPTAQPDGQSIGDAAAIAKTRGPDPARAVCARFQPPCRGHEIFCHFLSIDLTE